MSDCESLGRSTMAHATHKSSGIGCLAAEFGIGEIKAWMLHHTWQASAGFGRDCLSFMQAGLPYQGHQAFVSTFSNSSTFEHQMTDCPPLSGSAQASIAAAPAVAALDQCRALPMHWAKVHPVAHSDFQSLAAMPTYWLRCQAVSDDCNQRAACRNQSLAELLGATYRLCLADLQIEIASLCSTHPSVIDARLELTGQVYSAVYQGVRGSPDH